LIGTQLCLTLNSIAPFLSSFVCLFEGKALPLLVQLALNLIALSSFVVLGSTGSKFDWRHSIGSIGSLT